ASRASQLQDNLAALSHREKMTSDVKNSSGYKTSDRANFKKMHPASLACRCCKKLVTAAPT
ncbi:hypothetical protein, partial [Rhizobium leguminosarum]|uniref:hypothetical protein n=1 Tax=Rhizobium leguminosarum TaxID=384 RepID=UPI003F9CCCC0